MYKLFFKPIVDLILSIIGLIVLMPLIVSIILILLFTNNGKPFFLQEGPGKNGKNFTIIKFKTMRDLKIDDAREEKNDLNKVTKVGAVIRKYSLDEILQLVNALKGDMSLIGSKPLLIEYLPLYNDIQKARHHLKLGIMGWAQIKVKHSISWSQKFDLDNYYVINLSSGY